MQADIVSRLLESERQPDCLTEKSNIIREIITMIADLRPGAEYDVAHNSRIAFEPDGATTVPIAACSECDEERANQHKGAVAHMCIMHGTDVTVRRAMPTPGGSSGLPARVEALRRLGDTAAVAKCESKMASLRQFSHLVCYCGEPFGYCLRPGLQITYENSVRILTMCGSVFAGPGAPRTVSPLRSLTIADLYDTHELLTLITDHKAGSK